MPQSPLAFVANNAKTKATSPGAVGQQSELFIGSRHGRNYEAVYAGGVFGASNQAGVTTTVALATTYVGICLSNPAGSGKNLAVLNASGFLTVAPAALTGYSLILGYAAGGITAHTTPLTVAPAVVGVASTAVGLVDSACTLVGTPAWGGPLAITPSATGVVGFNVDIGGGLLLPPGAYLAIGSTIAGPASGFWGSLVWEEVAQ